MHTFLVVCIFFVSSDAACASRIPPKILQKNVAYGNKNRFFLHIYIFFCIFANEIGENGEEV